MSEKFNYYDAIANLVPGTIACLFVFYTLLLLGIVVPKLDLGSLGEVGVGVAVAYTMGHLLQSLASTFEPFYFHVWGGKPAIRLLKFTSPQFSQEQRSALVEDLVRYFKVTQKCPDDPSGAKQFHQRLFDQCMTLCNRNKLGRVASFNAVYAFHRALLTTFLIGFLAYSVIGVLHVLRRLVVSPAQIPLLKTLIVVTAIGTAIEIFRTRKRAYYFAREVLWMTSDCIRSGNSDTATSTP